MRKTPPPSKNPPHLFAGMLVPIEFVRWLRHLEDEAREERGETVTDWDGSFLTLGVERATEEALGRLTADNTQGRADALSHEFRCLIYMLLAYCACERKPPPDALLTFIFVALGLKEGVPSADLFERFPWVAVELPVPGAVASPEEFENAMLIALRAARASINKPKLKASEIGIIENMDAMLAAADIDAQADAKGHTLSLNKLAERTEEDRKTLRRWRTKHVYKQRRATTLRRLTRWGTIAPG